MRPTRRRAALVVLLAVLGPAACSGDDDQGFPAALAEDARDAGADRGAPAPTGACRLVPLTEVEAATGLGFQPGAAAEGTCTFRSEDGAATVTVNVTELPADAELALETTSSTCDEGSVVDVEGVASATGAFGCTVSGVQVAAGTSATTYAVVMGAGLSEGASGTALAALLGTVLEAADDR